MIIHDKSQLASVIDHTLLAPTATSLDIRRLCDEALQYHFGAICINPRWVAFAADNLADTDVKVASVISFPLGADSSKIKVAQAKDAIFAGADELDMVVDLAAVIEADRNYLRYELFDVLRECRLMKPRVALKLIIESAALTIEQKHFICQLANEMEVDYVKTSTGLHPAGGATLEDIALIKAYAPKCKIKASGGIKTAAQALAFLEAGADRIGTSSGIKILEEFRI